MSSRPPQPGTVRIGTSGWSYDHWRGVLYGPGSSGRRLEVYASEFDTVELDASFYHWPSADRFAAWRAHLAHDFVMAVKAPRGLSHSTRSDPTAWTDRIRSALAALGPVAGPLLLQLPTGRVRDDARLDRVLDVIPRECAVAVEVRHESWLDDEVFALLERHGAALCITHGAGFPLSLRAVAPLVYVRLHGPDPDQLYVGSYSDAELDEWAEHIDRWRTERHEVLVYFDNDQAGNAVIDARRLKERL